MLLYGYRLIHASLGSGLFMKHILVPYVKKHQQRIELAYVLCYDGAEVSSLTTEQNQPSSTEEASQPKKLTQAEAAKRMLAQKKQNAQGKGASGQPGTGTKKMTSQMTKKVNNQRKKMGT